MNTNVVKSLQEKAKQVLTPRELDYFQIMIARAGTLFVQGPPGGGKSAIFKSIASKLDCVYLAFDAPAMDETQLGLYPDKVKMVIHEGDSKRELTFVEDLPPIWAADAMNSEKPVLIVIEEMNRNIKLVNGILNILNERRIGHRIHFDRAKSPVMIAATGNLGDADGTIIEEFDAAQWGRLITVTHEIKGQEGFKEWSEAFANEHVHPLILKYLEKNPDAFRPSGELTSKNDNDQKIVVDGRRWTFLSEYLITNLGRDASHDAVAEAVKRIGIRYIGSTYAIKFARWLEETKRFTIQDVLDGRFAKMERENQQELVGQIVALDLPNFTKDQTKNVLDFIAMLDNEMRLAFIVDLAMKWDDYTSTKEGGQGKKLPFKDAVIKRFKKDIDAAKEVGTV